MQSNRHIETGRYSFTLHDRKPFASKRIFRVCAPQRSEVKTIETKWLCQFNLNGHFAYYHRAYYRGTPEELQRGNLLHSACPRLHCVRRYRFGQIDRGGTTNGATTRTKTDDGSKC